MFLTALWGYVSWMWQIKTQAVCIKFAGGGGWGFLQNSGSWEGWKVKGSCRDAFRVVGVYLQWRKHVERLRQKVFHMSWACMLWSWNRLGMQVTKSNLILDWGGKWWQDFLILTPSEWGWTSLCLCCAWSLQSCLTPCDPMDCSPPASSIHGILQTRTLGWVATPSSRGFFPTQGSNQPMSLYGPL